MDIKTRRSAETETQPLWKVIMSMLNNKDIVLLFFAYWINLVGVTSAKTGVDIFTSKMYGFTDVNFAKSY